MVIKWCCHSLRWGCRVPEASWPPKLNCNDKETTGDLVKYGCGLSMLKWLSSPKTGVAPRLSGFCFEKQPESVPFPSTANFLRSTDTTLTVAWQFGTQWCCFSPQSRLTFNGLGFFWIGCGSGKLLLPMEVVTKNHRCLLRQCPDPPPKIIKNHSTGKAQMHHTGICSWL